MTTIRASCPACGDVPLTEVDVTCLTFADDGDGQYRFVCPTCDEIVVKPAQRRTLNLLAAGGCVVERFVPPLEVFDPARMGAPIDADELIDAHELLWGEGSSAAFRSAVDELGEGMER